MTDSRTDDRLIIEVEATFLTREEGGRSRMPDLGAGRYMPHLVVQTPEVRTAIVDGKTLVEDYLGVAFVAGPTPLFAGRSGRFTAELMYHPQVGHETLEVGATFTIREGGKIVGYGRVVSRSTAVG
jgi:translation elongation factor EF-Tu-like GTPase